MFNLPKCKTCVYYATANDEQGKQKSHACYSPAWDPRVTRPEKFDIEKNCAYKEGVNMFEDENIPEPWR